MRRLIVISLSVALAAVPSAGASAGFDEPSPPPAIGADRLWLRPPVDAPVIDPFRPPDGPYGAGNRGLEYDTVAGSAVVAAAPGVVVFAGPVGGTLHVTVDHGGGLLTSYSFLDRVLVSRGAQVGAGDRVGLSGEYFHFGVRREGRYVDPARLFGRRVVEVHLVPHEDPRIGRVLAAAMEQRERLAFAELVAGDAPG
ncbi:MAG: peptidoglycan DD-metalloendopeptidase family protein, partial [Acidimicrobiales bacterium]